MHDTGTPEHGRQDADRAADPKFAGDWRQDGKRLSSAGDDRVRDASGGCAERIGTRRPQARDARFNAGQLHLLKDALQGLSLIHI